ncbi:branched-chain amino acid ABC transporter permease [Variovorax sp. KK3]|uniref:branched-chain amino acid ABC transporter permease n=1 Tax=Variovorax sp. KK3 TaxID=1855728 RepID=UPI00097C9577|nr:branched-chain amino acid ABC transporter permease [Variovorax sp. KK3]
MNTTSNRSILAVALVAAVLPLFLPAFLTFQLTQTLGLGIALVGLNVLTGMAGQPSLGHGAFFAIGAYATAMLIGAGLPWWVALPLACGFGAVIAYVIGKPILRLEHTYLALATFAIALAVPQLARNAMVERWTGGAQGLQLDRPSPPAWLEAWVDQDAWMYWVALALAVVVVLAVRRLARGRLGLELRALSDHTVAAAACGIDVARSKAMAFVLSAVCACVGGGLYALNVQLVTPDSFTLFLSLTMVAGLVVGGLGTMLGPWIGALFVQFVPSLADRISTAAPWAVFGVAILLVVFLQPRGIAGLMRLPVRQGSR